jgi:uncharacterized membrane protein
MAPEHSGGVPSTASIAGHPLHPMGVPLPVTFLLVLPFTDLAFGITRDLFWARVSWWLVVLGFISGAVAAGVGLVDFVTLRRVREHMAGWLHAGSNALALLLTFWNILVRWDNMAGAIFPWGVILSLLAAALVSVAGWYGGELVYRHKIGGTGG